MEIFMGIEISEDLFNDTPSALEAIQWTGMADGTEAKERAIKAHYASIEAAKIGKPKWITNPVSVYKVDFSYHDAKEFIYHCYCRGCSGNWKHNSNLAGKIFDQARNHWFREEMEKDYEWDEEIGRWFFNDGDSER